MHSIEIVYESGYWRVFHGLQFVGGSKDKRRAAVMADLATIILGSGSQEGTMQLAYPEQVRRCMSFGIQKSTNCRLVNAEYPAARVLTQFYATFKGDERWATRGIDELRVALSACPKRGNLTSPYAGVDLSLKTVKLGGEGQLQQTISFRSEASWASKKCSTGSHASEEASLCKRAAWFYVILSFEGENMWGGGCNFGVAEGIATSDTRPVTVAGLATSFCRTERLPGTLG